VDGKDTVRAVLPFDDFTSGGYIITATRLGLVKKTPLAAYRNINVSGIIGVKVPDGDTLVAARLCGVADRILLASRLGKAITFDESDARPVGRNSQGVRGIALKKNDELISMVVISREDLIKAGIPVRDAVEAVSDTDLEGTELTELTDGTADVVIDPAISLEPQVDVVEGEDSDEPLEDNGARTILTITNAGYGKRTPISQYRVQNRGGGGIFTIRLSEKRGEVAGCRLVGDNEELILITNRGKLIRTHVKGISLLSRNTQGVRVISLEETERVVGIACFEVDDEETVVTDANGEAVNPALVGDDASAEPAVDATPDDELRREDSDTAGDE
jgi:DNA gyrase subunit A